MKRVLFVVGAIFVVLLYASFLTPRMKFGGDAVEYVRLANSLTHGEGYTIDGHFNSKWPPVTPLLHSVVIRANGINVTGFKLASMLAALAGLWLSYLLLKRHYDENLALGAVLLATVSFPMIYWVVDVSSEAPYLLFSLAGLLLVEEALNRQRWLWVAGAGLALGLAALSRTIGLSLIIGSGLALVSHWVCGRHSEARKLVFIAVVAVLLVAAWLGYSRLQSGRTSVSTYGDYVFRADVYNPSAETTVAHRLTGNTVGYAFIFAVPDSSLRLRGASRLTPLGIVSAAIILLSLAGWGWRLCKCPRLAEWYLLVYGAVLLAVNWYDIRYLVPILPLLFFYFAFSVEAILRWITQKLGRPLYAPYATVCVIGILITVNVVLSAVGPQARRLRALEYSGAAKEIHDAALWIKQHRPDAVIMARAANMVWFWTQLPTVGIPLIGDPEEMWQHIQENKISHIIVDPDEFSGVTPKYLEPVLKAHQDQLEQVETVGKTRVYQLRPSATTSP